MPVSYGLFDIIDGLICKEMSIPIHVAIANSNTGAILQRRRKYPLCPNCAHVALKPRDVTKCLKWVVSDSTKYFLK